MVPTGHQVDDAGTAGVVARPPLVFLTGLVLGSVADRLLPLEFPVAGTGVVRWTIAGAVIVLGLALGVAGIRNFSRGGTPVPTNEPTRALVTSGIHRWTRDPIYLGLFLIYGGVGVAARDELGDCW